MTLGEYIWWAASRPFGWNQPGTLDCCTFVAGWIVARGHADPMVATHIRYDGMPSAMRVILKGGGLAALWTRGMDAVGVPCVDDPQPGDVGVILAATDDATGEVLGIYTGERWMTLGLRGINAMAAVPVKVWRP